MTIYQNTLAGTGFLQGATGAPGPAANTFIQEYEYIATQGQTAFTGNDKFGNPLSYVANTIFVALNGSLLNELEEYSATNGSTITLNQAASANDELIVYTFPPFNVADTYTQSQANTIFLKLTGGTISGNVNFANGSNFTVPVGNTVQRPTATAGLIRYNTSLNTLESANGTAWANVGSSTIANTQITGNIISSQITSVSNTQITGVINSDQLSTPSQYMGFKNKIINGAFEIWQRGTTRTFLGAGSYLADRFTCLGYQNGGHERVTVSSPVTGMTARYAMRVTSSSAAEAASGTRMEVGQKIENTNCFDLAGRTVTISFWLRCSAASFTASAGSFGNLNAYLQYNTTTTDVATGADVGDGYVAQTSIVSGSYPTTWTKYTVTGVCLSTIRNLSFRIQSSNLGTTTSSSSAWYEVTEIQVEAGPTATSFDYRDYGRELIMCQRYYEVIPIVQRYNSGFSPAYAFDYVPFIITKRVAATMTYASMTYYSGGNLGNFTPNMSMSGVNGFSVGSNGFTNYNGLLGGTAYASAEL